MVLQSAALLTPCPDDDTGGQNSSSTQLQMSVVHDTCGPPINWPSVFVANVSIATGRSTWQCVVEAARLSARRGGTTDRSHRMRPSQILMKTDATDERMNLRHPLSMKRLPYSLVRFDLRFAYW